MAQIIVPVPTSWVAETVNCGHALKMLIVESETH